MTKKSQLLLAEAFGSLHDGNPLGVLSSAEKEILWSLLTLHASYEATSKLSSAFEEMHVVAKAGKCLAAKIKGMQIPESVRILVPNALGQQAQTGLSLQSFSSQLARVAGLFGKAGHNQKTFKTFLLVLSSEYADLVANEPSQEDLAELFQCVAGLKSISGNSIGKRRRNFAREYAHYSDFAKAQAHLLVGRPAIAETSNHRTIDLVTSAPEVYDAAYIFRRP